MPKVVNKKQPKAEAPEQPILHPEVSVTLAVGPDAVTAEKAKELLGWEETEEKDGVVPELLSLLGKRVRLRRNTRNRYLTPRWLQTLRQEHLNKRWRFNGEAIVIGKYGNMLSGQHRLLSLILAEHERNDGENANHWKEVWPGPVSMETLIVYGVEETDDTFKTLNTGKVGTFAEFLFRHEMLSKYKAGDRKDLAKMVDFAVRLLWSRTGEKLNAFHPTRTHAEAEDFILRHPKLLRCVKHIYDENQRQKDDDGKLEAPPIGKYLSPGYASAMCYLMAASKTDAVKYLDEDRHGKACDLSLIEKAEQFWIDLAQGVRGPLKHVCNAIAALSDPETGSSASLAEKLAVFVLAWGAYSTGKMPTPKDLDLTEFYTEDEDGIKEFHGDHLAIGGIDNATVSNKASDSDEDDEAEGEEAEGEEKPELTDEQKKAKREEQKRKLMEMRNAKSPEDVPPPEPLAATKAMRAEHSLEDNDVMITKNRAGVYSAYGPDADVIVSVSKLSFIKEAGEKRVTIQPKDLQPVAEMVASKGHRVVLVEMLANGGVRGGVSTKMTELAEAASIKEPIPEPKKKPVKRK